MASRSTILRDVLFFLKNDLKTNITDPLNRSSGLGFVMTSYPQREAIYPLITIKCINFIAKRAGMQTTLQDVTLVMEIRVWARNEKEKDSLFQAINDRLAGIQFTASTGSEANDFHDFNVTSGTEIDEEGENAPKSRILQLNYKFYNI